LKLKSPEPILPLDRRKKEDGVHHPEQENTPAKTGDTGISGSVMHQHQALQRRENQAEKHQHPEVVTADHTKQKEKDLWKHQPVLVVLNSEIAPEELPGIEPVEQVEHIPFIEKWDVDTKRGGQGHRQDGWNCRGQQSETTQGCLLYRLVWLEGNMCLLRNGDILCWPMLILITLDNLFS